MLSILRKTTASFSKSNRSIPTDQYDDVPADELSAWEFVNKTISDDEGEDVYSLDGDGSITDEIDAKTEEEEGPCESRDLDPPDDVMSLRSLSVSPPMTFPVEMVPFRIPDDNVVCVDSDNDHDEEDDEVDDLYNDDFDDELLPLALKGRFGKQRIKKMGKKGGSRFNRSKRLLNNKPGCMYGKHGLGVQYAYI